ncbi:DNA-directed RNA polymerase I, subunit RPA34.5 [Syncephalis pseudoplumigaleata]|uniref:DNA-directed RNA polymerase I, subunit RPA34.5 n=1 Tax=Syncephalis pseudoplumigaleata TaxID=1712513 RepID=A0A4V1J1V2_9FUNG|nr:DNA-directed RNA polymerase I, subunit RPA34.5 [Syncephalis pseudoplumigaleata]|eukprot:RKP26349.1 DNA-directed RNA polymerase I, subunit RPA34.5 [Syncephalis pseudoplumigaleata]
MHARVNNDNDDKSAFDADTLEACTDDKELWLIRIPDNVKVSDLDGTTLAMPDGAGTATVRVGEDKYNVQCVGADASTAVGGREMRSMHCLVPSEDRLVLAPLPFAQYITLTHAVDIPSSKDLAEEIQSQTIKKRPHPEGLKMQFPLSYAMMVIAEEEPANKDSDKSEESSKKKKKHKAHHTESETPKKKKKKSKH